MPPCVKSTPLHHYAPPSHINLGSSHGTVGKVWTTTFLVQPMMIQRPPMAGEWRGVWANYKWRPWWGRGRRCELSFCRRWSHPFGQGCHWVLGCKEEGEEVSRLKVFFLPLRLFGRYRILEVFAIQFSSIFRQKVTRTKLIKYIRFSFVQFSFKIKFEPNQTNILRFSPVRFLRVLLKYYFIKNYILSFHLLN